MEIRQIGVVGAGQMGNGIAHVAAAAGYQVTVQDIADAQLDRARSTIAKNLGRQVKKERISELVAQQTMERLRFTTDTAALSESQLLIEAATENVDLKYRIFENMSKLAAPEAILASNTSSISITALASRTDRPERVIGMHFMNPVPVMKLVEIIRCLLYTSPSPRDVEESRMPSSA